MFPQMNKLFTAASYIFRLVIHWDFLKSCDLDRRGRLQNMHARCPRHPFGSWHHKSYFSFDGGIFPMKFNDS